MLRKYAASSSKMVQAGREIMPVECEGRALSLNLCLAAKRDDEKLRGTISCELTEEGWLKMSVKLS